MRYHTSWARWLRGAGLILGLLLLPSLASAREAWRGFCEVGNQSVITSGISSTTKVQRSFPRCNVTVFAHGGGLATIYNDNNGTQKANPFTANLDGSWIWYADNGRYDVQLSGANYPTPFTLLDILLCDPAETVNACGTASGTGIGLSINQGVAFNTTLVDLDAGTNITLTQNGAHVTINSSNGGTHNLLSTTHLDTIPASPPTRGDIITAQNLTSPSGVTPAWARLALGTNNQVLTSNAVDAIWSTATTTINGASCALFGTCNSGHHGLEFTIYQGGTALTSGTTTASYALMVAIPFPCTIDGWSLGADQGTATVKWWKVATGTAIPTAGNSINTSGVQLSTGTKVDSTVLTDFTTTAIAKNDSVIMDIFAVAGGMTYLDGVLSCHE